MIKITNKQENRMTKTAGNCVFGKLYTHIGCENKIFMTLDKFTFSERRKETYFAVFFTDQGNDFSPQVCTFCYDDDGFLEFEGSIEINNDKK